MVVAGGFLIGAILFAQVASPVHRVFDPLQMEGFISIKQLFSAKAHRVPVKAPDLTITTLEGKDLTLGDLCGLNQLVVINFWATWCRPCIEEMPALERTHTAYRHNRIALLGIATQDSASKVREFVTQHNITYEIALDKEDKISNAFGGVKVLPTTVFLDNKGNIIKIHKGYLTQRELELNLKNLLPK
ncbi:MAG: TlpA family protein disulfide reductase [Desulfobacterales bacterium]|nr:MAG: TlpA family protein disulfide reductase [Desulfobacterales bacterium]